MEPLPYPRLFIGVECVSFSACETGASYPWQGITVNKKAENVEASQADVTLRAEGVYPPVIEVSHPTVRPAPADANEVPDAAADELWYKDAIIYQLHVKAFADSNNDGIGDFAGLTQRLDYLQDLGVTALWLLPFYPSPGRDDAAE